MDQLPSLPASYRVERHEEGLSPLILGCYLREGAARLALELARAQLRLAHRAGWVVLIDQRGDRDDELECFPLAWN